MAFYPDELSPIEKLRNAGKSPELADLGLASMNRRQWKSLVLGKKDLGMNNFATIAEEKEEDISSDGSGNANAGQNAFANVHNKKITFPKPRKYITSRVAERKEEEPLKTPDSLKLSTKESTSDKKINISDDLSNILNSSKMNLPEVRQLIKGGKKSPGDDNGQSRQEVIVNYAFNEDKQWKDVMMSPPVLTGWPKQDGDDKPKRKEDKKKATPAKTTNKKVDQKKSQDSGGPKSGKTHASADGKNKSLNMKDVVNVYKNLTYGTKDEIKSFVEKLSFVKDEEKAENDKNLLSMMNLKALETKIKNLEKKSGRSGTPVKKRGKTGKKSRKAHTDNLARHKVVKVPATLDYTYSPDSRNLSYGSGGSTTEQKRKSSEEKAPWKYVGTQSVLDKTYLVYPSYPQPERKKSVKKTTESKKGTKKTGGGGGEVEEVVVEEEEERPKTKPSQSKVKQSKDVRVKKVSGVRSEGSNGFPLSPNRFSATTVCTVEFPPETERKCSGTETSDKSLLVYLHGTKATFVRSPYSDKQFSRVKFFRRDGTRSPLIKGVSVGDGNRSVRTPTDKPDRDNLYDLLDFEDDIKNINDFLRSQNRSGRSGAVKDGRTLRRRTNDDRIVEEISRDLDSLRYLPDTEENRQIIGHFFDELDRRIERSKARQIPSDDNNNNNDNCLIPIVGY